MAFQRLLVGIHLTARDYRRQFATLCRDNHRQLLWGGVQIVDIGQLSTFPWTDNQGESAILFV